MNGTQTLITILAIAAKAWLAYQSRKKGLTAKTGAPAYARVFEAPANKMEQKEHSVKIPFFQHQS